MFHVAAARGLIQACLYAAFAALVAYYTHHGTSNPPPACVVVLASEFLKLLCFTCSGLLWATKGVYHPNKRISGACDIANAIGGRQSGDEVWRPNSTDMEQQTESASVNTPQSTVAYSVLVAGQRRMSVEVLEVEKQIALAHATFNINYSVLQFTPVAVAYCISDNFSFYALSRLPAYSYTLFSALKAPVTAVLALVFMRFKLDSKTRWSMGLIALGACIGQVATYRATSLASSDVNSISTSFRDGCVVMLCMVLLSALASVALERIRQLYDQQPQRHSMREFYWCRNCYLTILGMLSSLLYCLTQVPSGYVSEFWINLKPVHWAAAASLAAIGMLAAAPSSSSSSNIATTSDTGSLLSSMSKMYALVLAPFFTAWANKVLQLGRAPFLFHIGAVVALAGVLRLHHAQSHSFQNVVSWVDKKLGNCGGWRPVIFKIWKFAFYVKIGVFVLLPLVALR